MPKRTDIKSIMIIGAGPIIIGQACEFDYSGTQACKALREEGYRIILVNSNPATIMTDPGLADATYIEPITPETVARIIEREKPDALLPTMGGQTGLNTALALAKDGTLETHGVELIGASMDAIDKAEDRERFKGAMAKIGLECPRGTVATTLEEAQEALTEIGLPVIIRPSFTMGGTGGGIAYNRDEFLAITVSGFDDRLVFRARCCNPIRGEKIVGYVTRGKGVSVHAARCPNVLNLLYDPERRIEVVWDKGTAESGFVVLLGIQVEDRRGILAEVTSKIAGLKTDVLKVEASSGEHHGRISVTVNIQDLKHLQRIIKVIRGVPGVLEVERLMR